MRTRRLVITADDFGFDPATNEAILELLADKKVTATTVMAVSPFAEDGADNLEQYRSGLGLHFILNSDFGREPWIPASNSMRELYDAYPYSAAEAELAVNPELVTAELEAQFDAMCALGLSPSRLDSHCGTLYGLNGQPFIGESLQFCAARGLGFRLPRSLKMYLGNPVPAPVAQMHVQAVRAADQLGVRLPEEMATSQTPPSEIPNYEFLRDQYISFLPQFPEGTSELFLHPSEDTKWARDRFGDGWTKRVWELRLLRDPRWWDAVDESEIELVTNW